MLPERGYILKRWVWAFLSLQTESSRHLKSNHLMLGEHPAVKNGIVCVRTKLASAPSNPDLVHAKVFYVEA